jgi:ABC-type nitrate/sulfonate/bicarbonate transport system permease component
VPQAILICAFIVAFFPVLSNTTQGLKSVDHNLLNLFELHGASRWQTLFLLKVPSALPYFLTGLRISGGLALIAAVVAEFAAGSAGAAACCSGAACSAAGAASSARAAAQLPIQAATRMVKRTRAILIPSSSGR